MSQTNDALDALRRHTDSLENIQLYLMQMSEVMHKLTDQIQKISRNNQELNIRVSRLEEHIFHSQNSELKAQ